jgi:hypothetical protein
MSASLPDPPRWISSGTRSAQDPGSHSNYWQQPENRPPCCHEAAQVSDGSQLGWARRHGVFCACWIQEFSRADGYILVCLLPHVHIFTDGSIAASHLGRSSR